jgi:hypothetical protein
MTPVIFREDIFSVTAVFPTIPGGSEYGMTCYAHIGQHSSCGYAWYRTTKPAKAESLSDLFEELKRIGYDDLKIVKRITPAHFEERKAACA